jgi:hypothetical protein
VGVHERQGTAFGSPGIGSALRRLTGLHGSELVRGRANARLTTPAFQSQSIFATDRLGQSKLGHDRVQHSR